MSRWDRFWDWFIDIFPSLIAMFAIVTFVFSAIKVLDERDKELEKSAKTKQERLVRIEQTLQKKRDIPLKVTECFLFQSKQEACTVQYQINETTTQIDIVLITKDFFKNDLE